MDSGERMKFNFDKRYVAAGVTAFAVIAATILFYTLVTNFKIFADFFGGITRAFMPVICGFAFAYLLSPVMNFIDRKCLRPLLKRFFPKLSPRRIAKISKITSALLAIMIAVGLIAGALVAVIPQVFTTIQNIAANMNVYLESALEWTSDKLRGYPEAVDVVNDFLTNFTRYLTEWLRDTILPQMTDIAGKLSEGLIAVVSLIFNIVVGFIICAYLLYGKDLFAAQAKKLLFCFFKPKTANAVLFQVRDVNARFGGFIVGKLLDCLVVGVMFFVVMSIFGVPYALLASVIMAVSNIIPYFGPFIGAVPAALLIFFVDPMQMLYFAIICVVIMQVDGNIIEPKILGDNTGLSTFWVIFALILGEYLFGIVGLIIGVPLFAALYALIKAKISSVLKDKGLPPETASYLEFYSLDTETGGFVTMNENLLTAEKARASKQIREDKKGRGSLVGKVIAKLKRGRKAFTLVELIIVLAILAVLAAVAIPTTLSALNPKREADTNAKAFYYRLQDTLSANALDGKPYSGEIATGTHTITMVFTNNVPERMSLDGGVPVVTNTSFNTFGEATAAGLTPVGKEIAYTLKRMGQFSGGVNINSSRGLFGATVLVTETNGVRFYRVINASFTDNIANISFTPSLSENKAIGVYP